MDISTLITAFPNLAFGLICLWFVQVVWKERTGELARYTANIEAINKLYIDLLERAVVAIANSTSQSTDSGKNLNRLIDEFIHFRQEITARHDALERLVRDSAKRNATTGAGSRPPTGAD